MCGVAGAYSLNWENVVPIVSISSQFGQNRGGISPQGVGFSDGKEARRSPGPPYEFFPRIAADVISPIAVGALRYGTEGQDGDRINEKNIPPIEVEYKGRRLDVCHNGQIPYYPVLRDYIETTTGYHHRTTTDTESLALFLLKKITDRGVEEGARELIRELEDAAFSVVALLPDENTLLAFRDRNGYRPLHSYTDVDRALYAFASEDPALSRNPLLGGNGQISDIKAGEVVIVDKKGLRSYPPDPELIKVLTPCKFENVYFGRPDTMDSLFALQRIQLGKKLYEIDPVDGDYYVIPDSDSGDYIAEGFSAASGRELHRATPKERHPIIMGDGTSLSQRGFITSGYVGRLSIAAGRLKLRTLISQTIVYVTDSIVRGTTILKNLISLYDMGAENVHVRIAFPPVTNACFQGIDIGHDELLMTQIDPQVLEVYRSSGDIAAINNAVKEFLNQRTGGKPNVESVGYMTVGGYREVVGEGCMRCLGRNHDGGLYTERINLPPFLREFTGREFIIHPKKQTQI